MPSFHSNQKSLVILRTWKISNWMKKRQLIYVNFKQTMTNVSDTNKNQKSSAKKPRRQRLEVKRREIGNSCSNVMSRVLGKQIWFCEHLWRKLATGEEDADSCGGPCDSDICPRLGHTDHEDLHLNSV